MMKAPKPVTEATVLGGPKSVPAEGKAAARVHHADPSATHWVWNPFSLSP